MDSTLGGSFIGQQYILILAMMLLPMVAVAYDAKIDGIYYDFDTNAMTATVTHYYSGYNYGENKNAYSGNVIIPATVIYNGVKCSVTSIGYGAFSHCSGLTSITIPDSVTSIGNYAFYGCSGLTSVTIPNSVASIGGAAFLGCSSLTSVTIPNSVTSIGDTAFEECSGLTSVTIGNSVMTIGEGAFYSCRGLTSVKIPNSVASIGSEAFRECSGLISVTIGNSVTSIGGGAFCYCSGLTSVTIPNSVTTIGAGAFSGCSGLTSVTIGTGVTSIGSSAFNNTALKKTIWLTNTPPSGWSNVKGTINYVANEQYGSSNDIIVYSFLSSIFEVDGIRYVPVSPSERTCDAIDCVYDETAVNTNISSSVTFKGISMAVKKVQPYVCYGNKFIEILNCDNDGEIAKYAFYGCSKMKNVTCNNIGGIADYAFYGCTNMDSLKLGERVTSIGQYSFQNCSSLQSVVIPDSVTQLGSYSFSGCSSLKSITLGTQVNTIGGYAFENCEALPSIRIPKAVKTISNYSFYGCTGLNTVIIADRENDLSLGSNGSSPLFSSCPLDSVYIGGDITYKTSSYYGYSPFYRNKTLRTVVITDMEDEISENEFYGCINLQSFSIGDGVTKFGNWAFSGCSSLKSLSFGAQLKSIGKEAFSDCTAVTKIVSKAIIPPSCDTQALDDINKWNCQLSVPEGCLSAYQSADQWKEFFFMDEKANDEDINDNPDKKCATPTIAFIDGEFVFDCETDDVQYKYEIKCYDAQKGEGSKVAICSKYAVIVYAVKPGYKDSDVATLEFTLGTGGEVCDVNKDGAVDVADIATIISEMAAHAREK